MPAQMRATPSYRATLKTVRFLGIKLDDATAIAEQVNGDVPFTRTRMFVRTSELSAKGQKADIAIDKPAPAGLFRLLFQRILSLRMHRRAIGKNNPRT